MIRPFYTRHFIIRSLTEVATQRDNTRKLQEQLTLCFQLLDNYFLEISSLLETLECLFTLPSEFNAQYGKYALVKKKYENSLQLLEGYKEQNSTLARRLEEVQVSWHSLDNLLLQRSAQCYFSYSSPAFFH